MATLTFLGAARTVTGSKYLLEHGAHRVLVDCGLFQGLKELRLRNWEPFPVAPASIDAVVLTHAHLDHVGYLPRLCAQGFKGRVICTPGTADLCGVVLPDAGRIQEEDARYANRHAHSRHRPALPLYTEDDARAALGLLYRVPYGTPYAAASGMSVEFAPAGHLLGSAHVHVRLTGGPAVLFGGDLGRYDRPVLRDPAAAPAADIVLVESTYGDREHAVDDGGEALAEIVRDTVRRGGKLIVPAFAIGRVGEVLYWIRRLEGEGRIPVLPVYVDSPMASDALGYYTAHMAELDPDMRPAQRGVSAFATSRFHVVASPEQSRELTASTKCAVVVSSSGMATGGRVLHHLAAALPDTRHTVLFVGYQAAGTRGRLLADGAPEVKIHGRAVRVAARVAMLDSMSAHADRREIVRWLGTLPRRPARLCLVHGEPGPMDALRTLVRDRLGWEPHLPQHGEQLPV